MLLSSGVIWRHRDVRRRSARSAPTATRSLQRIVCERLDDDLDWLEALGRGRDRARDRATRARRGARFDTRSLTARSPRAAGDVRCRASRCDALPDGAPVVLATGGFRRTASSCASTSRPRPTSLLLRATPWSTGDGLRLGLGAGGADSSRARRVLRPQHAGAAGAARSEPTSSRSRSSTRVTPLVDGRATASVFEPRTWSEIDVVQWTARQPGARACYAVARRLGTRSARRPDGRRDDRRRGSAPARRSSARRRDRPVEVVAGITTTLGGLRDRRARAGGAAACSRRAATRAGSRPAATPAASRRRSCSAGSRPGLGAGGRLMEHALRQRRRFTLGIEEELLLVDRETHELAPVAAGCCRGSTRTSRAGHEAYAAEIELRSPPFGRGRGGGARAGRAPRRGRAHAGATLHRRRRPPGGRLRRRPARRRRALPASSTARCAGSSGGRRSARCTSTSACPTPRPRSASSTAARRTFRCCRRSRRTAPVVRDRLGPRERARRARARLSGPRHPARPFRDAED